MLLRALVLAGFVGTAALAAASAPSFLELRAFSLQVPVGWASTANDDEAREAYGRLAEPMLQKLISTPPPVLLSVRAAASATSADGRNRLFATWSLLAADAETIVVDLRDQHDAAARAGSPDFPVREVVAIGPALIQGRAATRFTFDLVDGTRVLGAVFSLPDRPDALATVALVVADPAAPGHEKLADATLASITFGTREENRRAAAEATSFRSYLRNEIWDVDGASEGLLFIRRVVPMVVLFSVLFGGQLKLAQIFVQRRNALHQAAGDGRKLHSEKFILPISIVSITLTALAVSWLVTA